ncbi:hypothetical protein J5893_04340 [bacterium]|nr:hypothetical protein [bacterium]
MKGKKPSPQRSTFAVGDYSTTRSYDGVDKSLKNERNTRFFLYNSNNLRENSAKIDLHQDQDSEVMLQFSGLDHRIEAANINFTITFLDPTNLETKITGTYGSRGINFDNSALLDNKNIGYVQG